MKALHQFLFGCLFIAAANAAGIKSRVTPDVFDSSSLWYDYTAIDMEGGTIHGTASTNEFLPNVVDFAANYLTNFNGQFSTVISLGYGYGSFSAVESAKGNASIIRLGDLSLNNTFLTNCYDISAYDNASLANSYLTNCDEIYARGYRSLISSELDNVYFATADGDQSFRNLKATNTHDAFAYGSSLQYAVLNGTEGILGLGHHAGNGISGSYTNVVLIGDGSTIGSTGRDQVILGPAMSLSVGTTISAGSSNTWSFGGVEEGSVTNITITINGKSYTLRAN